MQHIQTKKPYLEKNNEEKTREKRFDFLFSLIKRSFVGNEFIDQFPVNIVQLDGSPVLAVHKGYLYLYLNIGNKAQSTKTDNRKIYSCCDNKEVVSLLIEVEEIKSLLDEIIANEANYYWLEYDDYYLEPEKFVRTGIGQFLDRKVFAYFKKLEKLENEN